MNPWLFPTRKSRRNMSMPSARWTGMVWRFQIYKNRQRMREISHVWRFSFLFCHRYFAQNSRIKFYTQKSAKIGFLRPFFRSSPNFATDLLQTCYKRLKRGPPTRFIINMQKWICFTFGCQKARMCKKKSLTFSGKRPYVWWKGTPASTVSPVDIPTGLGPAH